MEKHQGEISIDGVPVFNGTVYVQVNTSRPIKSWQAVGMMSAAIGVKCFSAPQVRLKLDDGRCGDMLASSVGNDRVEFHGCGTLEREVV